MGIETIAILGAGQLGYANSVYLGYLNSRNANIILYDRTAAVVDCINGERRHPRHFTGIELPSNVRATHSLEDLSDADIVFIDLHSTGIREVFTGLAPYLRDGAIIVNDAKGLEKGTHQLPLEVVHEVLYANGKSATLAARSGWMLAANMVNGERSYADVACEDAGVAEMVAGLFSGSRFKIRATTDVTGVQLAGIMKNVYVICAGLFVGLSKADPSREKLYGDAKAIYMAAATEEARQAGVLLGASPQTFQLNSNSWGIDYYSSCSHDTINRLLGEQIGLGMEPDKAYEFVERARGRKPEGYHTAIELYDRISSTDPGGIERLHILNHTYRALFTGKGVEDSLMEGATEISGSMRIRSPHGGALVLRIGRFAAKALMRAKRRALGRVSSKS